MLEFYIHDSFHDMQSLELILIAQAPPLMDVIIIYVLYVLNRPMNYISVAMILSSWATRRIKPCLLIQVFSTDEHAKDFMERYPQVAKAWKGYFSMIDGESTFINVCIMTLYHTIRIIRRFNKHIIFGKYICESLN